MARVQGDPEVRIREVVEDVLVIRDELDLVTGMVLKSDSYAGFLE